MRRASAVRVVVARARRGLLAGAVAASVTAGAAGPLRAQVAPAPARRDSGLRVYTGSVVIADLGPGAPGRLLRSVLARPRTVLLGDSTHKVALRRDTTFATSVVVIGGDATVGSTVHGDVVVVGGGLFLHPGARIEGRAIAIGGGVYNSSLATVTGGIFAYRDQTFDAHETPEGLRLTFRDLERSPRRMVEFPAGGLQLPEYDRVDGLVLPWGPTVTLGGGGVEVVPVLAYRSDLGAIDPRVTGTVEFGRRNRLRFDVQRGTFSNDRWIRGDIVNSLASLFLGSDARNYFRADRADARVERRWEGSTTTFTPFVGGRAERAWSSGPDSVTSSEPWSLLGRGHDERERMLRFNPPIARGNVSSALAGAAFTWDSIGVGARFGGVVEQAFRAPSTGSFTQATLDGAVGFPTFKTQTYEFAAHAVLTAGDAPPQRYAYLGGAGSLPTLELLEEGGDQLVFVENRYNIPIERVKVPFLGAPILTLRHVVGGAGVGRLPTLTQNVGVRLGVGFFRVDYMVDPATRRASFDASLALSR